MSDKITEPRRKAERLRSRSLEEMIRLISLAVLVIPVQALAGETHTLHATVEHEDGSPSIHRQPIDPVDCRQVVDRLRTRGPFRMRIGERATGKVVDAKCEKKKP